MTDTKNHTAGSPGSLEGRAFRPRSPQDTAEAVELAFDYRGDVTLSLASGELIVGYLFNRLVAGRDSYVEIFPADQPGLRRIPYDAIATIAFTGEDTANGKSWETWVSKKESERRAEAERIEADARTRGLL
ncbi:MAG TPA: hypothetical protein VD738_12470 [Nitrospira sp.]|nr:hypothetical protein [Nitrospira sp.]